MRASNIDNRTKNMDFVQTFLNEKVVLTEGGMIELIRRKDKNLLDPFILHAGMVNENRDLLEECYRGYIDIGKKYDLPFVTLAPTWRANPERIQKSGFSYVKNLNGKCIDFLKDICKSYGEYASKIFIGGLIACKGDAYKPLEALSTDDAKDFHRVQVEELVNSGVDFIKAATLPAFKESLGMAKCLSEYKTPYVLSYVVRPEGTLLDGTDLSYAIETIDGEVENKPFFYMINCVHPSIFKEAYKHTKDFVKSRILGIQANTSPKTPEELDGLDYLDTTEPKPYASDIISIHNECGIKLIGGCCGSNVRHIEEIAKSLCRES
jgi:homocysteine S-methyltransferase